MSWKIVTSKCNCAWLYVDRTRVGINKICGHKESESSYCKEDTCPLKLEKNIGYKNVGAAISHSEKQKSKPDVTSFLQKAEQILREKSYQLTLEGYTVTGPELKKLADGIKELLTAAKEV